MAVAHAAEASKVKNVLCNLSSSPRHPPKTQYIQDFIRAAYKYCMSHRHYPTRQYLLDLLTQVNSLKVYGLWRKDARIKVINNSFEPQTFPGPLMPVSSFIWIIHMGSHSARKALGEH